MIRKLMILVLFLLMQVVHLKLHAQKDQVGKAQDTVNSSILRNYNQKLAELEQQRKLDSVKKANLEAKLITLKVQDEQKRQEVETQLRILEERDIKRLDRKKANIDSLRVTAQAFPVKGFFNDTLFLIYSRSGSFSAQERATAISKRINSLKRNNTFIADSIKLVEGESTIDILFGETIIASISENDALWNNTEKWELAKKYKQIIIDSLVIYKSETSFVILAKEIGLALFVLSVIIVLIIYTSRLFKYTARKIQEKEGTLLKGVKIRNYTLFDASRQVKVLLNVNNVIKWLVLLLIVYISLPVLFGIFPWTQNFAETLFGYILNPLNKIIRSIWHYLPNFFTIVVILVVFKYVLKGIRFLKTEIEMGHLHIPGFYSDWSNPTYQIIRVIVIAFMIIVIFPYLPGSDSPIFRGVSVFLGFLFTFGSAGSLSNIVAGLVLTYMRLFKIGDRVKIGEVTGDVIEKSILVTRIRTIKNEIISIPNSTVMNSHTVNYSINASGQGLIIYTTVTIGYDVPWRDMHTALIDAALKTKLVLAEPKPFVLQTSLDDFYVSYQLNVYIREANKQAEIYSNLHSNIQDSCNEKGIEIMSPHYRTARDGNKSTIPEQYLPKGYKTPSFNVNVNPSSEQAGNSNVV